MGAELGVERNPIKPESSKEELWVGLSDFMCKIGFGVLVQCLLITLQSERSLRAKDFVFLVPKSGPDPQKML